MSTNTNGGNNLPKGARLIFGIFMILIYVGMGLLFMLGFFEQILSATIGNIVGVVLMVYGIWRGYRLFKGMN